MGLDIVTGDVRANAPVVHDVGDSFRAVAVGGLRAQHLCNPHDMVKELV